MRKQLPKKKRKKKKEKKDKSDKTDKKEKTNKEGDVAEKEEKPNFQVGDLVRTKSGKEKEKYNNQSAEIISVGSKTARVRLTSGPQQTEEKKYELKNLVLQKRPASVNEATENAKRSKAADAASSQTAEQLFGTDNLEDLK